MRIVVIGAGALGRAYGVRLAAAGERVAFVVRDERVADTSPFTIELVTGSKRRDAITTPERVARVPDDAEVVLVCVREDQLDDRLAALLAGAPAVPVVSLTPLLPRDFERLDAMAGGRLVAAQPGVVAYQNEAGIVRYWVPRVAPTLLDAAGPADAMRALEAALSRAGLPAKLEPRVREANPATTIAFFPLVLGLDAVGGTAEAVLERKDLQPVVFAALEETKRLAARVGPVASWADLLLKFASPLSLRIGLRLAERASPEAVRFAESHFGRKVHGQNLRMAREIVALAREQGVGCPSLERLLAAAERVGG